MHAMRHHDSPQGNPVPSLVVAGRLQLTLVQHVLIVGMSRHYGLVVLSKDGS